MTLLSTRRNLKAKIKWYEKENVGHFLNGRRKFEMAEELARYRFTAGSLHIPTGQLPP